MCVFVQKGKVGGLRGRSHNWFSKPNKWYNKSHVQVMQ